MLCGMRPWDIPFELNPILHERTYPIYRGIRTYHLNLITQQLLIMKQNLIFRKTLFALTLGMATTSFAQVNQATMYNGGGNNPGSTGSYYGNNCDATGIRSFAGGYDTDVSGAYSVGMGLRAKVTSSNSFAFGYYTNVSGGHSLGFGYKTKVPGAYAIGMGYQADASGNWSLALGRDVKSSGLHSIVLGKGVSTSTPLTNGINQSLMVGFNSNVPTFFVGGANGSGTYGKVGVGTSTPSVTFEVGDVNGSNEIDTKLNGFTLVDGANSSLMFGNGGGIGHWALEMHTNGLNFWKPFGSMGGHDNYLLYLHNNGNVGVNTDNPTAQFTVNGKTLIGTPGVVPTPDGYKLFVEEGILAEKVKVALYTTADWADYVFAPDYRLRPLAEVKQFVSENNHLPGVPSAQELVDDAGYDIQKMDATLLEKIEELTLYTIQLAEENKELKERINALENE